MAPGPAAPAGASTYAHMSLRARVLGRESEERGGGGTGPSDSGMSHFVLSLVYTLHIFLPDTYYSTLT